MKELQTGNFEPIEIRTFSLFIPYRKWTTLIDYFRCTGRGGDNAKLKMFQKRRTIFLFGCNIVRERSSFEKIESELQRERAFRPWVRYKEEPRSHNTFMFRDVGRSESCCCFVIRLIPLVFYYLSKRSLEAAAVGCHFSLDVLSSFAFHSFLVFLFMISDPPFPSLSASFLTFYLAFFCSFRFFR